MKKYDWNEPFNIIMEIKREYFIKKIGSSNMFEDWVKALNVKKYNDFIEPLQISQKNSFVLIRYGLAEMQRGMWTDTDSIYRQCRSLVVDIDKEEIVVSPFRKFFNVNEVEENKITNICNEIKDSKVFEVTDKLDGSMQSLRFYNNEYLLFGSMALSKDESWRLTEGYGMLTQNHKRMAKENLDYTFIFESITEKDAHVVVYDKSDFGLHLIGIIDVNTGYELSYLEVLEIGNLYNVKCVKMELLSFEELLEYSKIYKAGEKEGWVINIDGHRIKIKCDDYVSLHRILDKVSSNNVIIEAIADNKFDDLLSKIPNTHKKRVTDVAEKIYDYLQKNNSEIKKVYSLAPKENRKEFMIWVDKNVRKDLKPYMRAKYIGIDYSLLKTNGGKYKKIHEIIGE